MATATACPSCGSTRVADHCHGESHVCDLINCRDCLHFGTPDGRRWAPMIGNTGKRT